MSTMLSRDERRRRIMERGSDRLALITGRIKDITPGSPPPSPSSLNNSPQHPLRTRSFPSQPSFLQNRHRHSDSQPTLPHRLHVCSDNKEDDEDGLHPSSPAIRDIHEVVSKKNNDSDINKNNVDEPRDISSNKKNTDSVVQTDDNGDEKTKEERNIKLEEKRSSIVQKSQNDKELFTSKRLNSCIIASQNTRIISTLIIAVWAVSSYADCPLFGRNILISESTSSVITRSPLYILLITDITIVVLWLYFDKLRGFEELEEEGDQEPLDYHENWESAVKLLERGNREKDLKFVEVEPVSYFRVFSTTFNYRKNHILNEKPLS